VHPSELPTQQKTDTEDLGVEGKIHLRIIFKKCVGCFVLNACGSEPGPGAESVNSLLNFVFHKEWRLVSQGDRCSCHCWDFICLRAKSKHDEKGDNATRYKNSRQLYTLFTSTKFKNPSKASLIHKVQVERTCRRSKLQVYSTKQKKK